jgi:hypothetical protein
MSNRIRGNVNRGPPGFLPVASSSGPADLVNGLTDCLVQHMLGGLLKAIELGMAFVHMERPAPFRR